MNNSFEKHNLVQMAIKDLTGSLRRHTHKTYKLRKESKINKVVVHTADRDWSIEQLVKFDVEGALTYNRKIDGKLITDINQISSTGLPGATYHEAYLKNGKAYQLLPYEEISWHAGGYNSGSVAVVMMYRCTIPPTGKDTFSPTEDQLRTARSRCGALCIKFGLAPDRVFGHRELKGTGWFLSKSGSKRLRKTCPGLKVDLDEFRLYVGKYMQLVFKVSKLYDGEIDGIFGPKSREALERWKRL